MQTWDFAVYCCEALHHSDIIVYSTFCLYSLCCIKTNFFELRICEVAGVYGEGQFKANVAYPYMIAINNLSQFIAMYHLVLFYRAYRETLKPMRPIGKFLCIKAVVFFSFL